MNNRQLVPKTTGQLRSFLCEILVGIKDGSIDHSKAKSLCQIATRINESFDVEARVMKTQMLKGNKNALKEFGQQTLD